MNETMRGIIAELANAEAPKEACGFILDDGSVVSVTNVDDAPWYRFRMDEAEAASWWGSGHVAAVWHSHPTGPAVPSEGDEEHALGMSGVLAHLIYSVEDEDLAAYAVRGDRLLLVDMMSPA